MTEDDKKVFLEAYENLIRNTGVMLDASFCYCGNYNIVPFDEEQWNVIVDDLNRDKPVVQLTTAPDPYEPFLCKGPHTLITVQLATGPHEYCARCSYGRQPTELPA